MEPPAVHIVVIGPMGVGKSTIGGALAATLDRAFLDSDDLIESEFGMTGSEISATRGVAELHSIELAVFGRMAATTSPAVIAPAESVVDDPEGRRLLTAHLSVWLDAPDDMLAARRATSLHRRTISDGQAQTLREARHGHLEVCTIGRVDATAPVEACVDAVIGLVAPRLEH